MAQQQESGFPDTVVETPPANVTPLRAAWITRVVYCLALLALIPSGIGQASSWVGLALGGGLIGFAGPTAFLLIGAAILYRVYRVIRYADALDARPPYFFGRLVRWLGLVVMLVGVAGMVAMFLVRPLALMIFKSPGDGGIAFFVVGLFATMAAGVGWIGCVLFEISRAIGQRCGPAPGRSRSQRIQDGVVLASLVVCAIALPWSLRLILGAPCRGPTLGQCAARIEGGVSRMAAAAVGSPVGLQSNIEEIEFRHSSGREWVVNERPANSLLRSGHPVAQGAEADVKVSIDAAPAGKGARVVLTVTDKGERTAQFTTLFESRARIETAPGGVRKLVVELPRTVERPMLGVGDSKQGQLDEVYQQMRLAIGSPREVAEDAKRIAVTAILTGTSELARSVRLDDHASAQSCDGIVKREPGKAETTLAPFPGRFRMQATFLSQPEPAPTALLSGSDLVKCQDGAVWIVAQLPAARIQLRKYDAATATLHRNLLVAVPSRPLGVYDYVEASSLMEQDGQIKFSMIVRDGEKRRRENFAIKP